MSLASLVRVLIQIVLIPSQITPRYRDTEHGASSHEDFIHKDHDHNSFNKLLSVCYQKIVSQIKVSQRHFRQQLEGEEDI